MKKSLIIGISLFAFSQTIQAQHFGSTQGQATKAETTLEMETVNTPHVATSAEENIAEVYANQQMQRLNEINEMDKADLSNSEKKSLRKEVKEIKQNMQANSGGIYFSAGAIIIIILLLILFL